MNTLPHRGPALSPSKGFTLIETIIYLALFSILIGGIAVSAWHLSEVSTRAHTVSVVQEEGDFILAKILWVLYGARAVTTPPAGGPGSTLTVVKWDVSVGDPLVVALSGTDITLQRGRAVAEVLNNADVRISNLLFTHTLGSGDGINPESVRASFTLIGRTPSGQSVSRDFSGTSYLRQ